MKMRTPEITARLQGKVKRVEKIDGVNRISYVRPKRIRISTLKKMAEESRKVKSKELRWRPPVPRLTRLNELNLLGEFDAKAHEYNLSLDNEERLANE